MSETTPAPESAEPTPVAETAVTEPPALVEPAETPATDDVVVEPVAASPTEPVVATDDPAAVETAAPVAAAPSQHVVYVEAPQPPAKKGNRGFGVLIAVLSTVIFAILFGVVTVLVQVANSAFTDFTFVTRGYFWGPAAAFLVAFILLVLIVNRAGWAAHVLGSLVVGIVVFLASGLIFLLVSNSLGIHGAYAAYLYSVPAIVAGLLAREVSLWMGAAIAARGRRVKVRNVEAREAYDRDEATKRAEYERANTARVDAAPSVSSAPTPAASE